MAGSSAGGNLVWECLLMVPATASALAAPLAGYGTIGVNDSGARLFSGRGFTKPSFQICPQPPQYPYAAANTTALPTGWEITVYYTLDKTLNTILNNSKKSGGISLDGSTQLPVGSWAVLPASSDQSGTGVDSNPMTSSNPILSASRAAAAFRIVVTSETTPSGGVAVYALWVP